jgi:hypothetical protein
MLVPASNADLEHADVDDRSGRPNANSGTRPPGLWLVGLAVGVTVVRWLFAADRRVFHLFPDEAGQLAMARWLGGGNPWKLFGHSTWQPGFAILLAPVYVVTDDPLMVFRVALGMNACLAGAAAVLLAILARRLTTLSSGGCIGVAAVVSLLPASLSASAHAWAEPLVSLTFLGSLLALVHFVEGERLRDGLVAVVVSVGGFAAHGRLLLMAATVGIVVIGVECRRRRWARMGIALVVFALTMIAVYAITAAAQDALWEDPDRTNSVSATLRRLATDPLALVDTLIGQFWYLLVATAGLSFVGLWVVVSSAFKAGGEARFGCDARRPGSNDARVLLALLLPQVALSVLFTSDRGRIDQVIYGRYNDAVALPLIVVGIAWFVDATDVRRRAQVLGTTGGAMLVTTSFLLLRFGTSVDGDRAVGSMVAGLIPYYGRGPIGGIVVPAIGGLFVLLTLGLTKAMPRRSEAGFAAVLGFLVVVAGVSTYHGLSVNLNHFESARQVEEVRALVPPGETLGFRFVPSDEVSYVLTSHQRLAAQTYQMYLPEYEFVRDNGPYDDIGPYVFAPRLDPAMLDAGAVALWEAEDTGMTLWLEQR